MYVNLYESGLKKNFTCEAHVATITLTNKILEVYETKKKATKIKKILLQLNIQF
jgi:hypothetical protein